MQPHYQAASNFIAIPFTKPVASPIRANEDRPTLTLTLALTESSSPQVPGAYRGG